MEAPRGSECCAIVPPMREERRDHERVPALGALSGEVTVCHPVTIVKIATGGLTIDTPFRLQLDSVHEFRLTLADRSVVVKGRVAHCHIDDIEQERVTYRSGVEFTEMPSHTLDAISGFVHALAPPAQRHKDVGSWRAQSPAALPPKPAMLVGS